jgi:murein L,D-transpeptidase YafK
MGRIKIILFAILPVTGFFIFLNTDFTKPVDIPVKADLIIVEKGRRLMTIYSKGIKLKSYRISLGKEPVGDKKCQGDNKTPEGTYYIKGKDAKSRFHRSLWISYPDPVDTRDAQLAGKNPGGAILIHGITDGYSWLGKAHLLIDWTRGCIAVTNKEIEELFGHVNVGMPIEIRP